MEDSHETELAPHGYSYGDGELGHAHNYLLPSLQEILSAIQLSEKKVFDVGCGNGAVARWLSSRGWEVTGIDPSSDGIREGKRLSPDSKLFKASAYDNLSELFGTFPVVISLEVIEHLFYPRKFASTVFDLLEPGGTAVISTPYHGYMKNLALALTGKLDSHFTALWDYGHIKFWSVKTLTHLLEECGFDQVRFEFVGRIPLFASSMIAVCRRPI